MAEDALKPFHSNIAFADVGMAVELGAEGSFAVVGMDDGNVIEAEGVVGFLDEGFEAGVGGDVVTGGVGVAGVDAVADFEGDVGQGQVADVAEFGEAGAEDIALAGGVLEKNGQVVAGEALAGFGEGLAKAVDGRVGGLVLRGTGVDDEVLGADDEGSFDLAAKGGDRFGTVGEVDGTEVDEVVGMDDEGGEVEASADVFHAQDGGGIRGRGGPGSGTAGEDLQAVGAEFVGFQAGLFEGAGGGGMDADSQAFRILRIGWGMRLLGLVLLASLGFAAEWKVAPATANTVDLFVEKTGFMAGKKHWFRFPQLTGSFSTDPARVELQFDVKAMQCFDTWLSEKDQKKVLDYTLGKETLDVAEYPTVRFVSTAVDGDKVTGTLTIRGISKPVTVTVKQVGEGQYEGSSVFKMTEFGIKPAKAALGAVGTKDEMTLQFKLTGSR